MTAPLLEGFIVLAAAAGAGVALAAAPLGCFVVWRRMAYFGDAAAHAALLGVAMAAALDGSIFLGALGAAAAMALAASSAAGRGYAADTMLGVAAHSALALGLIAAALSPGPGLDLESYLFGDILAVTPNDLWVIWGGAGLVFALTAWRWSALLTATLNPDLALASGVNPGRERLIASLALAVTTAVAIKVVGALLIAALLVIPPAAARPLARTPEAMAVGAALIGLAAVAGGLTGSMLYDAPAGAAIVAAAAAQFLIINGVAALRRATRRGA